MTSDTLIGPTGLPAPRAKPDSRPDDTCPDCGRVLRVSGLERDRVYFERDDERSDDPVMNRVCPACQHGLPGKSAPWPEQ